MPFAQILRDAGLNVIEIDDQWEYRSRSSGGWDAKPLAVAWHHTASETTAENDCNYMTYNADAEPIANIYIADNGDAWVMAGGATNTSGSGVGTMPFSRGTVPEDQANTHTVGMEIGNGGLGQPYTREQLDSAFIASNAINKYCGNQPADVFTHNDYAPDRKIDPATAQAAGIAGWEPGSVTSSGTWSNSDLQAECARRAGDDTLPPPTTPPPSTPPPTTPQPPRDDEDEMTLYAAKDSNGTIWVGNGIHRIAYGWDEWNMAVVRGLAGSGPKCRQALGEGAIITDAASVITIGDGELDTLGLIYTS